MSLYRSKINDAYLYFPAAELRIPVGRFQADFQMDSIPTATITPALGRNLSAGSVETDLSAIKEQDEAQLWFVYDGASHLIMEGVVQRISSDDSTSLLSRRQTANITLSHRLVGLASHPAASLIYTQTGANPLAVAASIKKTRLAFAPGSEKDPGLITESGAYKQMSEAVSNTLPLTPGHCALYFMESLIGEFSGTESNAYRALESIQAFDGADISKVSKAPYIIMAGMLRRFVSVWKSQNAWQGLLSCLKYMWLHVIPYNAGAYLANPLALIKTPAKAISSREYQLLSQDSIFDVKQPIDGVVVLLPGLADSGALLNINTVYPPVNQSVSSGDQGIVVGTESFANRNYVTRSVSQFDWLVPYLDRQFGGTEPTQPEARPATQRRPGWVSDAGVVERDLVGYMENIGTAVAKYLYGREMTLGKRLRVQMGHRPDMLPGTLVVVQGAGGTIDFMGTDMYGMIDKVSHLVDNMGEKPQVHTVLDITSVRSAAENAEFGIDENPVYAGVWPGVDLNGGLLGESPQAGKYRKDSAKTFDSATGSSSNGNRPSRPVSYSPTATPPPVFAPVSGGSSPAPGISSESGPSPVV